MRSRSRTVSSVTLKMRRVAAGAVFETGEALAGGGGSGRRTGAAPFASAGVSCGSSSNGRSNRFPTETLELGKTVAQSLDRRGEPRSLVRIDENRIQPGI